MQSYFLKIQMCTNHLKQLSSSSVTSKVKLVLKSLKMGSRTLGTFNFEDSTNT